MPLPERIKPTRTERSQTYRRAVAIVMRVAAEAGLTLAQLRSPQRHPELVSARVEAIRLARQETDASLPQIGRILNRHHTTILHHLQAGAPA